METKIAVIGGGSVNWMPTLMRDVYMMEGVDGGEIRLIDPDIERAEAVASMLNQFNKQRNKEFKISVVPNRREGLDGVDMAISTFCPGGIEAYHYDLEVPVKYGIQQPVSGTVGPCGIYNALRTVSVANEVIQDMEEMCPGAWMLSETNPMTAVTDAMNRAAKTVKVIGMCHEFHAFGQLSKAIFGFRPPKDIHLLKYLYEWLADNGFEYTIAGINHFIWLTQASLNGNDALPMVREFAANNKNNLDVVKKILEEEGDDEHKQPEFENWAQRTEEGEFELYPWENHWEAKLAAARRFGHLSIGGDRHMIEFIPSFCNMHNGFGMQYGVVKTTGDHRKHLMDIRLDEIKQYGTGEKQITWNPSPEELTVVMEGILFNKDVPCIVNLPNKGQISNLPEGAIVETFATVNGDTVTPTPSGDLPEPMASYARLHLEVIRLTIEAGLEADRSKLLQALSLDPLCQTIDFNMHEAMADDMIKATRKWLPRWK